MRPPEASAPWWPSESGSLRHTWIDDSSNEPSRSPTKARRLDHEPYVPPWIAVRCGERGGWRIPIIFWDTRSKRSCASWRIEPRRELTDVAKEAGAEMVCGTSLKAVLDRDWDQVGQREEALDLVLKVLQAVETWVQTLPPDEEDLAQPAVEIAKPGESARCADRRAGEGEPDQRSRQRSAHQRRRRADAERPQKSQCAGRWIPTACAPRSSTAVSSERWESPQPMRLKPV